VWEQAGGAQTFTGDLQAEVEQIIECIFDEIGDVTRRIENMPSLRLTLKLQEVEAQNAALLAASKALVFMADQCPGTVLRIGDIVRQARVAIAKVEGTDDPS
jgi:hypothetical protein